jgi:microcystin-dependent protein
LVIVAYLVPLALLPACVTTNQLHAGLRDNVPVGTVAPYAGLAHRLPEGWMFADGRSLDRSQYPELYAALAASWGSSSTTTFNIPDLRARFLRGVDSTASRDPEAGIRPAAAPGGASGNHVGSVQEDALQQHQHDLLRENIDGSNRTRDADGGDEKWNADPNLGRLEVRDVKNARVSPETRPKNAYVYWVIRIR